MSAAEEADHLVLKTMKTYGGSFVRALSEAFHQADPHNFGRLKDAFPEIWKHYREVAVLTKKGKE